MTDKEYAYHQDFLNETEFNIRRIGYHIRQAERYKKLYGLTKNVRGYRWLNWIARRRNAYHCKRGSKLARGNLTECLSRIKYLTNYLKDREDSV